MSRDSAYLLDILKAAKPPILLLTSIRLSSLKFAGKGELLKNSPCWIRYVFALRWQTAKISYTVV